MSASSTSSTFLNCLRKSGLLTDQQLTALSASTDATDHKLASELLRDGVLTQYQAKQLLAGKSRGFFLGGYKILRPIGQGGFGVVYLAEHTKLSRMVAIKVLDAKKAGDPLVLERFAREARATAALDHPNIVQLHDFCRENGVSYLVMEYIEGNDLQKLMEQTGPLHFAQAAQYVAQAAVGLRHAHEKGIVHRDIKPANLMLVKTGEIKVMDMGLARSFVDSGDNLTAQVNPTEIVGTIDYLSPEQAFGSNVDARSDIYSLGATLFALVTGRSAFHGTTVQKLCQRQMIDLEGIKVKLRARVPEPFVEVVARMMAVAPEDRYQTASEVIDALEPWLATPTNGAGSVVAGNPPSKSHTKSRPKLGIAWPQPRPAKPIWKKPAFAAAVGGLGLAVVLTLAFAGSGKAPTVAAASPAATQAESPQKPADAVKPPAVEPKAAAVKPPLGPLTAKAIYRLDLAEVRPFRKAFGFGVDGVENANEPMTGGLEDWVANVYKKGAKASYSVEMQDGHPVLGIEALDAASSQWTFRPTGLFEADTEYRVHVEYRTEAGCSMYAGAQMLQSWETIGSLNGPPTVAWRKESYTIKSLSSGEVQVLFTVAQQSTQSVWVRRFEIEKVR